MGNNGEHQKKPVKPTSEVMKFAEASFKKFKKKNEKKGVEFDNKKEAKKAYYCALVDRLPEVVEFFARYGYIRDNDIQNAKKECYAKILDEDFGKYLAKKIKKDDDLRKELKLFPIVLQEIIKTFNDECRKAQAENPNVNLPDITSLKEVFEILTKKRAKEFEKRGIDAKLANSLLAIIPNNKAYELGILFRVRSVYNCLNDYAKEMAIPFKDIMDILVDKDHVTPFVVLALLDKKEGYENLNESQRRYYSDVTTWCFETLESMKESEILECLNKYIETRKKDEMHGNDSPRRYQLSTLSATDYPRTLGIVNKLISQNESIKKYL